MYPQHRQQTVVRIGAHNPIRVQIPIELRQTTPLLVIHSVQHLPERHPHAPPQQEQHQELPQVEVVALTEVAVVVEEAKGADNNLNKIEI